jgi:hypothetical protein
MGMGCRGGCHVGPQAKLVHGKRSEGQSADPRKGRWTARVGMGGLRASMTPTREAWIVDYVDQEGDRHIETFARKKDADDYHATVKVDIRKGVHSAERNGCRGCGKLDQAG